MVVNVFFVDVSTYNKGVVPLCKAPRQLAAQAVGLLRCDLPGDKGLADGVCYHIVPAAPSAGPGMVLPLGEKKFRTGNAAVTLVAGDQPAIIGFFGVLNIVDDIGDRFPGGPACAGVQGCNARCGDKMIPPLFRLSLFVFLENLPDLFHHRGIPPAPFFRRRQHVRYHGVDALLL